MTADHRIGQIQVLNHGLQFSCMISTDLTTEDDGELVGLTDGAVGIHQSLAERSTAARREKIRLSQSATCEKNSRWFTPACWRSLGVKNGINCVSHLRPQPARSRAVNESAISCRTAGSEQPLKALV